MSSTNYVGLRLENYLGLMKSVTLVILEVALHPCASNAILLRFAIVALILTFCVGQSIAQARKIPDSAIANAAQTTLQASATVSGPGVAVLIARGHKVIYRAARGKANIELGVSLSPDQIFRIASITKMFTAALVIKLDEAGELSLNDHLDKFFPDFPGASGITIRELLSHTAGVSDRSAPPPLPGFMRREIDTSAHLADIAARPPSYTPGTEQSYSNAGFILLGAIVEKVTGKPWYGVLSERILQPLGLKNTGYGSAAPIMIGRVAGYTTDTPSHSVANAPFLNPAVPAAAGALNSSLDDLRLWMRALVEGRVINRSHFDQMITPAVLPSGEPTHPYGFGMFIWHVRGETMIGHTGQIDGFASVLAYLPSRDITIVALGNDDNFDAQNFGRRLAAIAIGRAYRPVKSVQISPVELVALTGQYQQGSELRTFLAKDGKLYSQRPGRAPLQMQMTANGEIHFVPDELSFFLPVTDSSGSIIRMDYFDHGDGPPRALPRIH